MNIQITTKAETLNDKSSTYSSSESSDNVLENKDKGINGGINNKKFNHIDDGINVQSADPSVDKSFGINGSSSSPKKDNPNLKTRNDPSYPYKYIFIGAFILAVIIIIVLSRKPKNPRKH